jgi:DNA-binding PadR family transcriptional regulator
MLLVTSRCDSMSFTGKSRTVGVPRGLLKFLVLKMINEKPMSGVEIVEEIEKQTGSWKPSSGSIYPLLAQLHEKGLTKELPTDALGFKRYIFTDEGQKFFKKQLAFGQDFIKRIEFLAPMLIGGFDLEANNERFRKTKESAKNLMKSFIVLRQNTDRLSEKDTQEISASLNECFYKLEKIVQKIKNEQ